MSENVNEPREERSEVLRLSHRKWGWMSDRDVERLSTLFHEAAVFVHMGATFTKDEELDVISSGRIHYRDFRINASEVQIVDATAVVLTTMELTAVVGGAVVTNPFTTTEVFVRQGEDWRLTALAFTRLLTPAG